MDGSRDIGAVEHAADHGHHVGASGNGQGCILGRNAADGHQGKSEAPGLAKDRERRV